MHTANTPADQAELLPIAKLALSPAAERAWSFDFDLPLPVSLTGNPPDNMLQAMPQARLKARAELVRGAFDCGTY